MLQIESVHFGYKAPVFQGLSLTVEVGNVIHLQGANGAGKTTLLRLVAGVLAPNRGKITWKSGPLQAPIPRIGYVPAGIGSFYPRLTVRENLEYFGALAGLNPSQAKRRMLEVDPFGIDYWEQPLEFCSQGMRQKVSWVRALMIYPEILLLDEAWNALDASAEERAMAAVVNNRARCVTLLAQHGRNFAFPCMRIEAGRLASV